MAERTLKSGIEMRILTGAALDGAVDQVAALRIAVFRDYPYLYDGDLDYERRYLATYQKSAAAVLVGAFDGPQLVGAATGTPMEDHAEAFGAPFLTRGMALDQMFYCAESVLLPQYRGRGIGHGFFDLREAHARDLGRQYVAFCSVIRDGAAPKNYRPLDGFWRKRGYAPLDGAIARFSWKDLGDMAETEKHLQFWMRTL